MDQIPQKIILVMISLVLSACATSDAIVQTLTNPSPDRILFVGNSYLYYNDSLHNHVGRMADETFPERVDIFVYKSDTIGGSRLAHHALDHLLKPDNIGVEEPFEVVILQGGSKEPLSKSSRKVFYRQVAEMTQKIRAAGAEVALYMTHAYLPPHEDYYPDILTDIKDTYLKAGRDNNVLVLPVGLAFANAYKERPSIKLHKVFDSTHPDLLGTYLASCVVFAALYQTSPAGLDYNYFGAISDEDKQFLQRIAAETVTDFYGHDFP